MNRIIRMLGALAACTIVGTLSAVAATYDSSMIDIGANSPRLIADNESDQTMSPQANNIAEIINSGSTNTAGYDVKISPDATVKWSFSGTVSPSLAAPVKADGSKSQLDAQLVKKLFSDLEKAMPLSQYPHRGCAKSSSFGYTLIVRYKKQDSPDLSCPLSEAELVAINEDVQQILKALSLTGPLPRR
ncbi:MAG TPA: hypothetical protein V6C69_20040 [Trichormus sp.]